MIWKIKYIHTYKLNSDEAIYKSAKKKCKITVNKAKEAERVNICHNLEEADEKELFRMVKQMKK